MDELFERVRTFGRRLGETEFAGDLEGALRDGLADLDALSRDDPFWRGWANEHVTVAKLTDHAAQRLAGDPGDRTARLCLIALRLDANDAGLPLLAAEIAKDAEAVADAA
ncbi:hypothetical protein ACFQ07_09310, partial [Actinomadura adrarensis]